MARRLDDIRLAALMLDGIELEGRCCVVLLGITTDGVKVQLGLWDGSTENKTVARHLLSDLVERGLDVEQGVLVVLDGGKALTAAVNEVLGPVPVQRCIRHGGIAQPLAGTADRTLRELGKAPTKSPSARPVGALPGAARTGRQLNARARLPRSGGGPCEFRSSASSHRF